jgi:hypothetical protein
VNFWLLNISKVTNLGELLGCSLQRLSAHSETDEHARLLVQAGAGACADLERRTRLEAQPLAS